MKKLRGMIFVFFSLLLCDCAQDENVSNSSISGYANVIPVPDKKEKTEKELLEQILKSSQNIEKQTKPRSYRRLPFGSEYPSVKHQACKSSEVRLEKLRGKTEAEIKKCGKNWRIVCDPINKYIFFSPDFFFQKVGQEPTFILNGACFESR